MWGRLVGGLGSDPVRLDSLTDVDMFSPLLHCYSFRCFSPRTPSTHCIHVHTQVYRSLRPALTNEVLQGHLSALHRCFCSAPCGDAALSAQHRATALCIIETLTVRMCG